MKTLIKMQFDPEIAKELGVGEAIMYANIEFWCGKNEANEKHFHDGYYWTYNSKNAFTELFPFWTERQIRTILDKLKNRGYIKTGNYNKNKYDRTLWYTIVMTDKSLRWTKKSKGADQKVQPIPDSKPNNKPSLSAKADEVLNSTANEIIMSMKKKKGSSIDQPDKNEIFNYDSYLDSMEKNKNRNIQIIRIFFLVKQRNYVNIKQVDEAINRNLTAAKSLAGYSDKKIKETMEWLNVKFPNDEKRWTLETVGKYIDDFKSTSNIIVR